MRDEGLVKEVRELKSEGWSNSAIASKLGVTKSIISRWCIEIPDKRVGSIVDYNQNKRNFFLFKDVVNSETITTAKARLYAALLYWCERSKDPA